MASLLYQFIVYPFLIAAVLIFDPAFPVERLPVLDGMMDKAGNWTGKYGVRSWQDFLRNPAAQDAALIDWTKKLDHYIRSDHATRLGQTFTGIRATITITESGLAAAIHKQGSDGVKQYLNWLESLGWNSRDHQAELKQTGKEGAFRAIETRLRVFQSVPYKQQP